MATDKPIMYGRRGPLLEPIPRKEFVAEKTEDLFDRISRASSSVEGALEQTEYLFGNLDKDIEQSAKRAAKLELIEYIKGASDEEIEGIDLEAFRNRIENTVEGYRQDAKSQVAFIRKEMAQYLPQAASFVPPEFGELEKAKVLDKDVYIKEPEYQMAERLSKASSPEDFQEALQSLDKGGSQYTTMPPDTAKEDTPGILGWAYHLGEDILSTGGEITAGFTQGKLEKMLELHGRKPITLDELATLEAYDQSPKSTVEDFGDGYGGRVELRAEKRAAKTMKHIPFGLREGGMDPKAFNIAENLVKVAPKEGEYGYGVEAGSSFKAMSAGLVKAINAVRPDTFGGEDSNLAETYGQMGLWYSQEAMRLAKERDPNATRADAQEIYKTLVQNDKMFSQIENPQLASFMVSLVGDLITPNAMITGQLIPLKLGAKGIAKGVEKALRSTSRYGPDFNLAEAMAEGMTRGGKLMYRLKKSAEKNPIAKRFVSGAEQARDVGDYTREVSSKLVDDASLAFRKIPKQYHPAVGRYLDNVESIKDSFKEIPKNLKPIVRKIVGGSDGETLWAKIPDDLKPLVRDMQLTKNKAKQLEQIPEKYRGQVAEIRNIFNLAYDLGVEKGSLIKVIETSTPKAFAGSKVGRLVEETKLPPEDIAIKGAALSAKRAQMPGKFNTMEAAFKKAGFATEETVSPISKRAVIKEEVPLYEKKAFKEPKVTIEQPFAGDFKQELVTKRGFVKAAKKDYYLPHKQKVRDIGPIEEKVREKLVRLPWIRKKLTTYSDQRRLVEATGKYMDDPALQADIYLRQQASLNANFDELKQLDKVARDMNLIKDFEVKVPPRARKLAKAELEQATGLEYTDLSKVSDEIYTQWLRATTKPGSLAPDVPSLVPKYMVDRMKEMTEIVGAHPKHIGELLGIAQAISRPFMQVWRPMALMSTGTFYVALQAMGAATIGLLAAPHVVKRPDIIARAALASLPKAWRKRLAIRFDKNIFNESIEIGAFTKRQKSYPEVEDFAKLMGESSSQTKLPMRDVLRIAKENKIIGAYKDRYATRLTTKGPMGRAMGKTADSFFELASIPDETLRLSLFIGHLKSTRPQDIAEAVKATTKVAGAFHRLGPWEHFIKEPLPFYAWTQFIGPRLWKSINEHPKRLLAFERIKQQVKYHYGKDIPITHHALPDWSEPKYAGAPASLQDPDRQPGEPFVGLAIETPLTMLGYDFWDMVGPFGKMAMAIVMRGRSPDGKIKLNDEELTLFADLSLDELSKAVRGEIPRMKIVEGLKRGVIGQTALQLTGPLATIGPEMAYAIDKLWQTMQDNNMKEESWDIFMKTAILRHWAGIPVYPMNVQQNLQQNIQAAEDHAARARFEE